MQEVKKVITEVGTNEWQVVVFFLGEQSFAINVDKTREILRWPWPTLCPDIIPRGFSGTPAAVDRKSVV